MRQHILRLIYRAAETSNADVIAVNEAPMIEFIDCGLYEGDKHGTFLSGQPRSLDRCRENANCDSQPHTKKRTDSGLNRKTVQDKFFKVIRLCLDLLQQVVDTD